MKFLSLSAAASALLTLTNFVVPSALAQSVIPTVAQKSASSQQVTGQNPSLVPAVQTASAAPGTITYTVKHGDSIPSLVRAYLPRTSYMTFPEFESALRTANGGRRGNMLHPGESLVIPGVEESFQEKSIPVAKDFEVRAVYLTGIMAGSARGMRIIERWRQVGGNAVVFDIKDSDGILNTPAFNDPLVSKRRPCIRNLPKFVRYLHSQHMHAIARIAIFRDESLVTSHPELAVQSHRNNAPWRENGKLVWTDPSRPEVQKYNIAIAKFAAQSGVDEIQFDYVRFPAEGDQKDATFSFYTAHPQWKRADVIVDFLDKAFTEIHPTGVLLSLDVFGVMAWQRPVDLSHTGQDIPRMAKHCDVLSPMIYPSHFFGMEGYAHPGDAPEHFISESMQKFEQVTAGTGVVIRPWLQAFAWRTKTYSPQYIVTQVTAAKKTGGIGFLFWNANNDYSKPYVAMPEMRATPGKFFRGDELPGVATAHASQTVPGTQIPVAVQ